MVSFSVRTDNEVLHYQYKVVSLSVRTGPLYQYKEVAQARASLSVQCKDNKVCVDKFCTDIGSHYPYCTDNETLV